MRAFLTRLAPRVGPPLAIAVGAVLLRVIAAVGFANYDTLYALAWGGQLSRGSTPAYGVPIAPTPHPLLELLGLVLSPFGPRGVEDITVALGFLALSGCGWVLYRLGAQWFGRPAGVLAGLIFLTRAEVLSYGVRAYIDVPYVLLVLSALLLESHSRQRKADPAGMPVLVLLALAGLLRPEAWAFSGLYWLYLIGVTPAWVRSAVRQRSLHTRELAGPKLPPRPQPVRLPPLSPPPPPPGGVRGHLPTPGAPLWSLTNPRHTAETLGRETGITKVPEYIPRRIGEILRPPVLFGAALGGVLSLLWLRQRALLGAGAGMLAVVVFAAFATLGLPINTRYAFLSCA